VTPSGPPPHRPDDDQPSEFLTPVHPFETIEPEGGEPVPSGEGGGGGRPFRRPSNAILAAILVVVLVAAGIVVASTAQRSTGPPGAPRDLTATAAVCATACERIEGTVTLSWSPPEGQVDRYVVERDGEQIGRLPPSTTRFESDGLLIGHAYTFGVWAVGDGVDGPTSEVRARTPTPPLAEAQLTGTYRMRETVRRATNLSTLEGIANPVPGSTGTNTWSFDVVCAAQAGACPTDWFSWGPLENRGVRYDGTFHGRKARCAEGGTTPTTTEMHLVVSRADVIGGRWVADRFAGSMRVSFGCRGGRSIGVLRVEGRART
jgi:hypothetical protein